VRLEIFDIQGRLLRILADAELPMGQHSVDWDLRAQDGRELGAGVYLYRIQAGAFRDQKKMVMLRR
jgi:flagellar hook assembly protein FlgD